MPTNGRLIFKSHENARWAQQHRLPLKSEIKLDPRGRGTILDLLASFDFVLSMPFQLLSLVIEGMHPKLQHFSNEEMCHIFAKQINALALLNAMIKFIFILLYILKVYEIIPFCY